MKPISIVDLQRVIISIASYVLSPYYLEIPSIIMRHFCEPSSRVHVGRASLMECLQPRTKSYIKSGEWKFVTCFQLGGICLQNLCMKWIPSTS